MASIDILADLLQTLGSGERGVGRRIVADRGGELSMGDEVCVASDGGGEMRVDLRGEAVVSEFGGGGDGAGGEVFCGHHAAGGEDADEGVEEGFLGVDAAVEGLGEGF